MANSDNDGCCTIIFWMIAIVVAWRFIVKACSGKKQTEQTQQYPAPTYTPPTYKAFTLI